MLFYGVHMSDEIRHWPYRVVWAKQYGWLEVEDPFTGTWHLVRKEDALPLWIRLAMDARDPKVKEAERRRKMSQWEAAHTPK